MPADLYLRMLDTFGYAGLIIAQFGVLDEMLQDPKLYLRIQA